MLRSLFRSLVRPSGAAVRASGPRRLHLGCGRDIRPGWINLDSAPLPGVDVIADLDDCRRRPLPFADDSMDAFLASHVLEHLRDPLALMQELHRIARPQAEAVFRVPYGSSDDADEDPTHVRRYFPNSFQYFSQLVYARADYGYRGDWEVSRLALHLDPARHANKSREQLLEEIRTRRNIVREMVATLSAVKPARAPGSARPPLLAIELHMGEATL